MAINAEEISKYGFKAGEELLLDANVWFFLYGPHRPGDPKAAIYSAALKGILAAKSRIYIDVLIVSEFINRYARLKHQLLLQSGIRVSPNFKWFRQSSSYKEIAKNIAADVKKILVTCVCIDSGFGGLNVDSLVSNFGRGDSDFNDLILAELCRSKGLKLVTDDGDFKGKNIPILTAKKRLLS